MPDRDWWSALWPDPQGLLQQIGIRRGMSVLDLCCGDGYFTGPLAALVAGRVAALDLDPAMIELAKAEVERSGASVRQWICADATSTLAEHLDEPVDFVLIANTFHGVPDQIGLACSVREVLKPDGLFCIVNWHPAPREETVVLGKPPGTANRDAHVARVRPHRRRSRRLCHAAGRRSPALSLRGRVRGGLTTPRDRAGLDRRARNRPV